MRPADLRRRTPEASWSKALPVLVGISESCRILANTMRKIGKTQSRHAQVTAYVCASIAQTLKPGCLVVPAPRAHYMVYDPAMCNAPSDMVYPVNNTRWAIPSA